VRIRAGVTGCTAPSRRRRFVGHSVGAGVCHNLGDSMNANKIADELESISWLQGDGKVKPFQHYADFIRKQHAEIKALKAEKIRAYDNGYEDGRKPNTNKAQEN